MSGFLSKTALLQKVCLDEHPHSLLPVLLLLLLGVLQLLHPLPLSLRALEKVMSTLTLLPLLVAFLLLASLPRGKGLLLDS